MLRILDRPLIAAAFLAGVTFAGIARPATLTGEPVPSGGGPRALAASTPVVTYGGGPVISHPKIVSVFWGPNVISTITQNVGGFYSAFVDSNNLDWLCEYATPTEPIGRGSFAGNVTITPSTSSTNLADATIGDELAMQINATALPMPDVDTIYMVQFPPGVTITDPFGNKSCQAGGFCAYHGFWTRDVRGVSTTLVYGIMPNFGTGGCPCGNRSVFDNFTKTASHEIVEAMTDPIPATGWSPEVGDPCSFSAIGSAAYAPFTASNGTAYVAQTEWSRRSNACVGGGACVTAAAPAVTFAHSAALAVALCALGMCGRALRRSAMS